MQSKSDYVFGESIVAIPAFNEAKHIARTINLIKATGFTGKILVINDGSTDKTAEIARAAGAEVLQMPKNVGKAAAIFAAFKEGIKRNCHSLITFDADMEEIPKRDFKVLAGEAEKATGEKKTRMVVAFVRENSGIMWLSADISGVRSYSQIALQRIVHAKDKGKVKGFGIEQFLNLELGERGIGFMSDIVAGETLRQGERQAREIGITLKRLKRRVIEANAKRREMILERLRRKKALAGKPK